MRSLEQKDFSESWNKKWLVVTQIIIIIQLRSLEALILFLIFGSELLSIYQVNSTNLTDSKRSLFIMDQPLQITQLASSSRSSTLTRIVKTIAEPSTPKNYDRLSILIDHDLFKSLKLNTDLFQKLKLSNESLILNPTWHIATTLL